jgi:hypothetical protein
MGVAIALEQQYISFYLYWQIFSLWDNKANTCYFTLAHLQCPVSKPRGDV